MLIDSNTLHINMLYLPLPKVLPKQSPLKNSNCYASVRK
nr:MAG TPA: hypothetical protein [Caudoviricetes sp.]